MTDSPAAFMSYVRFNDQHDDGQVSEFRERLGAEVRVYTGEEFAIFQDRKDIAWGQNWQRRINEALDAVTLLLVIITPSFFRSRACRAEVKRFLAREHDLGREDLILPVYYVTAPELDDPERRDADELARVLASRQYTDWRELRFEPLTSPLARKAMAQLATRIRDTLRRPPGTPSDGAFDSADKEATEVLQSQMAESLSSARITGKTEPPTHVVDPYQRHGFVTIAAAIAAAQPGDRILVRPGLYREKLVIDKPIEILGVGSASEIVVQARDTDAVLFKANIGRIANLTMRQLGEGEWAAINITQGRLDLDGCDISSQGLACVAIRGGADPRLRRNVIHRGTQAGVFVADDGLGTLEDNDIFGNGWAGVIINSGANPTLRRNTIHDGMQGGVVVGNGLGTLEDNDIFGNAFSGVEITDGGKPILRRNTIRDGQQNGVLVQKDGEGTLEDNDIFGNATTGVLVRRAGNPTLRSNRVNSNEMWGVWISDNGRGLFEDNDLTGNRRGSWRIAKDSKANVRRVRNRQRARRTGSDSSNE
jgi:F-box protein 11